MTIAALTVAYIAGIMTGVGSSVLIVAYLRNEPDVLIPKGDGIYILRPGEPHKGAPSHE